MFESYGEDELKGLNDFCGTGKQDIFQGRMLQAEPLYGTQLLSQLLEFRNFKSYVSQQKIALSQEYSGKEKSLKSKFDLLNTHKYKTSKYLRELEEELYIIAEKVTDPLSVEDLLKDTFVETAFPNIQRLLKVYVLIPSSEIVIKRGFLKMGQIIMLMWISYHKKPLSMNDVKWVLDNWEGQKEPIIFSSDLWK